MTKRYAPATERNREAILGVLRDRLPDEGTVLEISAGTGQHAVFFAPTLGARYWLPTDIDEISLASIASWREETAPVNLLPPQSLDVLDTVWPVETVELPAPISAVVNINMLHIAPWSCCEALFAGAARILKPGATMFLYGPFRREGQHSSASNASFDDQLRSQDPQWGVRDLEAVISVAVDHGFECREVVEMPANNLSVIFVCV